MDFQDRSAAEYDDGSSFRIGRIDMAANTGTYLDAPYHRYERGEDLADVPLQSLAGLPGVVVRRSFEQSLATSSDDLEGVDVGGRAVLIDTGWDRYWRTNDYGVDHPSLTEDAARWLITNGAALVGIDSNNIDDTRIRSRPVHTLLLGANIPICEHLTGLAALPDSGFCFRRWRQRSAAWGPSRCAPMRSWADRERIRATLG